MFPVPIVRFDATEEEIKSNNVFIDGSLKELTWPEDTISVIKSLIPLISQENGKLKVKYNFTHLSNILDIPKWDIYRKLIELYHEEQKTAPKPVANFPIDQSVSPNTSLPFPVEVPKREPRRIEINAVFKTDDSQYELSSDDDNASGVNLNMASGFLYRNKLGLDIKPVLTDEEEEDDNEVSLESLLLEEEVLKQI